MFVIEVKIGLSELDFEQRFSFVIAIKFRLDHALFFTIDEEINNNEFFTQRITNKCQLSFMVPIRYKHE